MKYTGNTIPMRPPCGLFSCEGGKDLDTYFKHYSRPFRHASTSRSNWKRTIRKRQRAAWKRVEME